MTNPIKVGIFALVALLCCAGAALAKERAPRTSDTCTYTWDGRTVEGNVKCEGSSCCCVIWAGTQWEQCAGTGGDFTCTSCNEAVIEPPSHDTGRPDFAAPGTVYLFEDESYFCAGTVAGATWCHLIDAQPKVLQPSVPPTNPEDGEAYKAITRLRGVGVVRVPAPILRRVR